MMPHHVVDRGQSPYRPSEGYGVSQPAREVKGRALKPPLQAHLEAEVRATGTLGCPGPGS